VFIVALFTCALQGVSIKISCVLCISRTNQQSTLVPYTALISMVYRVPCWQR